MNHTDEHHIDASANTIIKYGTPNTHMKDPHGHESNTNWNLAEVHRALHSVSGTAGPAGGISKCKANVLFSNDVCVVVPPGIVEAVLKTVKPWVQYDRHGNLYTAIMETTSFQGQGNK